MELVLIGLSRFARRRVLPAVSTMDDITAIDVVSRHAAATGIDLAKPVRFHRDRGPALEDRAPALVYVSLVNSEHEDAVRQALECGHHVVVDKPAFLTRTAAEQMVSLARRKERVLVEATCYSYHPMFPATAAAAAEHGAEITQVSAAFTPPVPPDDFRHDARGGGALLDTGPYFASLGRVLWDAEPDRVEVIVGDRSPAGLPTSYSVLAGYPGGRTIVGHFGFTAVYRNALHLSGRGAAIDLERPFSAPPDLAVSIRIDTAGESHRCSVPAADSMRIFLTHVLRAAADGTRDFDEPLLSDARTLDRLRSAAAASYAAAIS